MWYQLRGVLSTERARHFQQCTGDGMLFFFFPRVVFPVGWLRYDIRSQHSGHGHAPCRDGLLNVPVGI